jgi:hypothetical protein
MKRRGCTAAVVAAMTLIAGACSSSSSHSAAPPPTSTTTSAPSTTSTTGAANGATAGGRLSGFRSCMATRGITLAQRQRTSTSTPPVTGTGGGGGGGRFAPPAGVDPAKFQSALDACRSQIPNRGAGQTGSFAIAGDHAVVYKVTGSARSASVVYSDSGGANDAQVAVPYQVTVRLSSGAFFSVVAGGTGGATMSCEVAVDGKTISTNTAPAGAVADCHGTVP